MSSKTQLIPLVTSTIPNSQILTTLDCGCGFGKWANILRTHLPSLANTYMVGLDIFKGNLRFCKKYGAYDDLILADIKHLPFKDDCVDLIVACEVIEHIKKKDGVIFLKELERMANGRILISTPNGSWPDNPIVYQDGSVNIYETHQSAWYVHDFSSRGYHVHAIGIRISMGSAPLFQQIMAGLDFLLFPAWFFPSVGRHLMAYKDKKPSNRLFP
jgi:SAM-dependent methyltransferase